MSRKDYIAMAESIRIIVKNYPECRKAIKELAEDIANTFKCNNSRFDYSRFYNACGLED